MKTYVNEIKENENVDSLFLVREKSSGVTKAGNAYLKLKLGDRSGEMEGRIWTSVGDLAESFEKDDFVHVKGKAVSFQEHLQLNITHIERVGEEDIVLSDFFPVSEKDIDGMFQSLTEISQQVKNHTSASFSASSGRTNSLSSGSRWPLPPNGSIIPI